MNALELADDMENGQFNDINYNKKKAADFVRKQQSELDYWKEMFEKAMSVNEQIRYLEAQVYGGTTK